MEPHPFHEVVGRLIMKHFAPDYTVLVDRACDPEGKRVSLINRTSDTTFRYCDVDILIAAKEEARVIIEIEESNVKPVQIFGKLFASGFSTHYGDRGILHPIDQSMLFIQVVDSSALKMGKTKKVVQWRSIQDAIQGHLGNRIGRIARYELIDCKADDFRVDSAAEARLIGTIRTFLGNAG